MPRSDWTIRNARVVPCGAARNVLPLAVRAMATPASRQTTGRMECVMVYFLLVRWARAATAKTGMPLMLEADETIVHFPVSGSGKPSAIRASVLCSAAQFVFALVAVPRQQRPTVKMLSIGRYPAI